MRNEVVEFLKAVVEGRDAGYKWHQWLTANTVYLKSVLSAGSYLRLKFYPLSEAKRILAEQGISYDESDRFEWLSSSSTSGRCRYCGEPVERSKAGAAWCPKGCFRLMV